MPKNTGRGSRIADEVRGVNLMRSSRRWADADMEKKQTLENFVFWLWFGPSLVLTGIILVSMVKAVI